MEQPSLTTSGLGLLASWWEKEQGSGLGSRAKVLVFRTGALTLGGLTPYLPGSSGRHCSHTQPERLCAPSPLHTMLTGLQLCAGHWTAGQVFIRARAPRQSLEHLYLGVSGCNTWANYRSPSLPLQISTFDTLHLVPKPHRTPLEFPHPKPMTHTPEAPGISPEHPPFAYM